jgi:hypothetical protein
MTQLGPERYPIEQAWNRPLRGSESLVGCNGPICSSASNILLLKDTFREQHAYAREQNVILALVMRAEVPGILNSQAEVPGE